MCVNGPLNFVRNCNFFLVQFHAPFKQRLLKEFWILLQSIHRCFDQESQHRDFDTLFAETSALLQAAGLKATITAAEKVVYTPVSTDHDSATLHVYRGKIKHPMVGARCNMEVNLGTSALPKFTFNNLIGLFVDPTQAGAFQNCDYSAFTTPMKVRCLCLRQ
mgnify:CR=1 FL=1